MKEDMKEQGDKALRRRMEELQGSALQWWAGEAEVVRVYFSRKRTKEDDIRRMI